MPLLTLLLTALLLGNMLMAAESAPVAGSTFRGVELVDGALSEPHAIARLVLSDAEWRKRLSPEAYSILRSEATERPFCGGLLNNKEHGYYVCAGCGLPLFQSGDKFNSGTGWPSFSREVHIGNVKRVTDDSHGMVRTEIRCARCDGHLGHVFDDGPAPTGERHCLNSGALTFVLAAKP